MLHSLGLQDVTWKKTEVNIMLHSLGLQNVTWKYK